MKQARQKLVKFFQRTPVSLRARMVMGVALPVFLALLAINGIYYWQEFRHLDEYARLSAIQLGEGLSSSIAHAMQAGNEAHLFDILQDLRAMENVHTIQIVRSDGVVLSPDGEARALPDIQSDECWVCHQYPPAVRPRSIDLPAPAYAFRVSIPIASADCTDCAADAVEHLGVLMIDVSLKELRQASLTNLGFSLIGVVLFIIFFTWGVYALIDRLVVGRIEAFREPIIAYAAGDHSVRIAKGRQINDEICQLADTYNQMADELQRYTRQQAARGKVRQQAIVEERERIARELHDGVAQILGYVNTKAMAVRLMLGQGNIASAEQHLLQLEEAARGVFVDVREVILGLRMAGDVDTDLPAALRNYVERFNLLSDIPISLVAPTEVVESLPPEVVLQLLRIVQESLSNIRKHARADTAQVVLAYRPDEIYLEISDDGRGFEPDAQDDVENGSFGLATMQERAAAIGAAFRVESSPAEGTQVILQLPRPMKGS